jgi:hypothetical protein
LTYGETKAKLWDMVANLRFDEIGLWSEIKLDILKEYASAYSTILAAQKQPALQHIYIDAFAGAGVHRSKATQGFVREVLGMRSAFNPHS